MVPSLQQLLEIEAVAFEFSDGEHWAVDGERRRDDVDARAVGQARVADRARFIDAAADLADDALADVHELHVVGEAHAGLLHLAVDLDVGRVGAVDHDVGDLVARQQRLERTVAQHVVADVLEQLLLLGDRHHDVLDLDDLADDVADLFARGGRIELGELRQIDGVDQRVEDRGLYVVVFLGVPARRIRRRRRRPSCRRLDAAGLARRPSATASPRRAAAAPAAAGGLRWIELERLPNIQINPTV